MKRYGWLILVVVLIVVEYIAYRRVVPPEEVRSLDDFLVWRPAADQFVVVDANGGAYLIAYGPESSVFLVSSGPSAYVFDSSGQFVDWSSDIGDNPTFDERWNAQRSRGAGRSLGRDEAARWPATRPGG